MQLHKRLRLLITFYQSFFAATFLISAVCAYLFFYYGLNVLRILIPFKILTLVIVVFYINNYKGPNFLYFQNLGLSKSFLWISIMIAELTLFTALLLLTTHI